MKLKIQINLCDQPSQERPNKPPFDQTKITLLMVLLLAPPLSFAAYALVGYQGVATLSTGAKSAPQHDVTRFEGQPVMIKAVESKVAPTLKVIAQPRPKLKAEIPIKTKITTKPTAIVVVTPEPEIKTNFKNSTDVVRAILTTSIIDREPKDDLGIIIKDLGRSKIYFFNEVINMNNQVIYHRWRFNNKVVATVKLSIGSDRWRTYSSKTLNQSMSGKWVIDVVNEAGTLLTTHKFDYYH
ncbi:MAG: DUF2914 domain-containing protein [Gammaproteobacteria bacterium]|nr:DUF2914 domain-containing protein [Gammaproteobacteria bacterium]